MKTNQHTPEQIIKILDQAEKGEQTVAAICREHSIAETTFYRWRKSYAGMSISEVQRPSNSKKRTLGLSASLLSACSKMTCSKSCSQKRAENG